MKYVGLLLGLIYIPFSFYGSYLLLKHVQATELMWFIYWMNLPVIVVSTLLEKLAEHEAGK
jgi:hypothetical protein